VKLNEFKQVDEVNLSHVLGDYGSAAVKQIGNRITGNPEGQLSIKDKMAKQKFIADFIGRANTNLNSAIKSGLVDPKAGTQPAQSTTPANTSPQANQNNASPNATQPNANTNAQPAQAEPETPEQKRIRLQKAAQQNIDKEAVPFSKLPANQTQTQIANKRQQKQNAAAQTAQSQMAPFSKLPTNQAQVQSTNIRQKKQGVATQNAQGQMAPFSKLPADQVQKQSANIRQKKQGVAAQNAQATMTPKPVAPQAETPAQKRMRLQQAATQNIQASMKESKFYKLDALFESIVEAGEQPAKQTISQYLQNMFKQYMGGKVSDPQALSQMKALADEVQKSYPNIKAPLSKMAELAFATSYSQGNGKEPANATAQPQSALDAIKAGVQQGLGKAEPEQTTSTEPVSTSAVAQPTASAGTSAPTTEPTATATPAKQQTAYKQALPLLSKLDKKGKQRILKYIEKSLGVSSAPAKQEPEQEPEAPSAFGNMARQLDTMGQKKSSTGGTSTPTGTGVRHTSSATNPNKAKDLDSKIDFAKTAKPKKTRTKKTAA